MKNNSRHASLLTDFSSDASWLVNCPFRALSSFRLPIQLLVYFRETVGMSYHILYYSIERKRFSWFARKN